MAIYLIAILSIYVIVLTLTNIEHTFMGKVIPIIIGTFGIMFVLRFYGIVAIQVKGLDFLWK